MEAQISKIAIISYYKSDFDSMVAELVENEGFQADPDKFVWIAHEKDIPNGILFDHVMVELGSEDMYSWADLEKLKSKIPLKREKYSDEETSGPQISDPEEGGTGTDVV